MIQKQNFIFIISPLEMYFSYYMEMPDLMYIDFKELLEFFFLVVCLYIIIVLLLSIAELIEALFGEETPNREETPNKKKSVGEGKTPNKKKPGEGKTPNKKKPGEGKTPYKNRFWPYNYGSFYKDYDRYYKGYWSNKKETPDKHDPEMDKKSLLIIMALGAFYCIRDWLLGK